MIKKTIEIMFLMQRLLLYYNSSTTKSISEILGNDNLVFAKDTINDESIHSEFADFEV